MLQEEDLNALAEQRARKDTLQCVKTLYPCSSHQNSWDLWMFIPLKMVCIGIHPYPHQLNMILCKCSFLCSRLVAALQALSQETKDTEAQQRRQEAQGC